MPVIKPRAPEYPRPVSPICADEIPTCKDVDQYYNNDDGVEEDEKQRLAKRRRIEAHATSYLRGQPLFILSAGLRGPFDDGWQNPWAGRRSDKTTVRAAPSPQRSFKLLKPVDQATHALPPLAKKPTRRVATDANEDTDPHSISQGQGHQQHEEVPELRPVENKRAAESSVFGDCVQLKDKKVENWLRMSEVYEIPGYKDSISTPPSPSERRKKTQNPSGPEKHVSPREDIMVNFPSDNTPRQIPSAKPYKQHTKSFSSPLQDRALPHGDEAIDSHSSPVRPRARRTPLRNRDSNVLPPSTIESRAEYAILKSRRGTIQQNATATDASSNLHSVDVHLGGEVDALQQSHPENRLQSTKFQEQYVNSLPDVHSASNNASVSLQTAQEQPLARHHELGPMSPGKQTSESGMTTDLPSAQVPEIPMLPSLPSNISSHDQMLRDSPYHERVAYGALQYMDKTTGAHVTASEYAQIHQHAAPELGQQVSTRLEVEADSHRTQENESVVISKSVLEGASRMVRTLKASFDGVSKGASPVGVKKTSGLKSRKRQAFASEEKHASIKAALKVARPNAASEEATTVSKASLEGDAGLQALGIESHEGAHEGGSPITSRTSVPKSILKAVTQHSMKALASNTGSSSTKPDAQKQRMLTLVDNEDGFDLEGAIDDLGSFLDTWDAEKQAAGVL